MCPCVLFIIEFVPLRGAQRPLSSDDNNTGKSAYPKLVEELTNRLEARDLTTFAAGVCMLAWSFISDCFLGPAESNTK